MMARSRSYFPRLLRFTGENIDNQQKDMAKVEADQQGSSPFHSMLDSVHQNVRNLMQGVLSNFNQHTKDEPNLNGKEDKPIKENMDMTSRSAVDPPSKEQSIKSGGKMVVIRDGPGYHEEKTYNFGPNADVGKIFDEKMDDMSK